MKFLLLLLALNLTCAAADGSLPGTQPLSLEGDIAMQLVDGADRFLLRKIVEAKSPPGTLERFREILGVRDARNTKVAPRIIYSPGSDAPLATAENYKIFETEWHSFSHVNGIGLMSIPNSPYSNIVISIPDCAVSPEQLAGVEPGVSASMQYSRHFAELNCLVITPLLIDRTLEKRRNATLTHREYLYRSAFVLGRHIIGYEIQ